MVCEKRGGFLLLFYLYFIVWQRCQALCGWSRKNVEGKKREEPKYLANFYFRWGHSSLEGKEFEKIAVYLLTNVCFIRPVTKNFFLKWRKWRSLFSTHRISVSKKKKSLNLLYYLGRIRGWNFICSIFC